MRYGTAARRWVALSALAVGVAALAAWLGRPRIDQAIRVRLEREAVRRGLGLRLEAVHVGLSPLVRLVGVRVNTFGAWPLSAATPEVSLRLFGRRFLGAGLVSLGAVDVSGPAGLTLRVVPTQWDLARSSGGWRTELREPAAGLSVATLPEGSPGVERSRVEIVATDAPLGKLVAVQRAGVPLFDADAVRGALSLALTNNEKTFELDLTLSGARLAALGSDPAAETPKFGLPTDATVRLTGAWRPLEAALTVPNWRATVDGAAISGALAVTDMPLDPQVDLSLEVERVDFARLLGTSGLSQAAATAPSTTAEPQGSDLGSASLSARIRGRLAEPRSFTVVQRLDFTPPRRALPALEALRGDFDHEVLLRSGGSRTIRVAPASQDFVRFREVPTLFVRTLLLGEDSGFFGHHGIDLSELPSAILTNWARGDAARGASTITQQLAKNLFLSREKKLGRKLQELSLALLLEATLDKERILEIYLNIIEWGPDLYGLGPAARHYFGRAPNELSPRQMAFLVALIPGPVKYQRSFADGSVSAGFRPLVDALLAKLRSVDALSEDEYQAALAEELHIGVALEPAPDGSEVKDPPSP